MDHIKLIRQLISNSFLKISARRCNASLIFNTLRSKYLFLSSIFK